jgi:hypothetical protein
VENPKRNAAVQPHSEAVSAATACYTDVFAWLMMRLQNAMSSS